MEVKDGCTSKALTVIYILRILYVTPLLYYAYSVHDLNNHGAMNGVNFEHYTMAIMNNEWLASTCLASSLLAMSQIVL
jgi:hypothetical protein